MNMVEDKYSNIEISFFILNNKRLEKIINLMIVNIKIV